MNLSKSLILGAALTVSSLNGCTQKPQRTPEEVEQIASSLAEKLHANQESSIEIVRTMVRDNCTDLISYHPEKNEVTFGCQDPEGYRTERVIFDEILPIKADE